MKSQTISIAVVGGCGVALMISFLTTYSSLQKAVTDFYTASRFAHVFAGVRRAPNYVRQSMLDIPGVEMAETRIVFDATIMLESMKEPAVGRFVSLPDIQTQTLNQIFIRRGRLPDPFSLNEVVVTESFALANHLEPGMQFDGIINGHLRKFLVCGTGLSPEYIYAFRGATALPDDRHFGIVWMSDRTLSELLGMQGSWNSASISLESGASVTEVTRAIDVLLSPYGGMQSFGRARHPSDFFLQNELVQLETQAVIMPFIFLGVAAFLLHVVIARLIAREREQIATLKALGYSNISIAVHYLYIVVVMITLGTIIGILPGILIGKAMIVMYREYFRFPSLVFIFDPFVPVEAFAASMAAAVAGAIGSLREAFRLPPAEAMRPPAPPVFRSKIANTIAKKLPAAGKMAVRNFTVRPFRALLSVLGLSLAMGIVFLAFLYKDCVDYLMELQFNLIQHEDASVIFTKPVSRQAMNELTNVPGIVYVEGYRMIPVRFWNGNLYKETAISGMPADGRLRPLLSENLKKISLPAGGILMNVRMAARLGLSPGDIVQVEILEGSRKIIATHLAGVVEELLGIGSYMEIRSLNRLAGEDDLVSMAALSIDPAQSETLFVRLRNFPATATVDSREAMKIMFQTQISDLMIYVQVIMIAFACVIAVGVVYNMVMVSLSERAWELASLRILGFTIPEVFRVLLGEIVVQLALSIPAGLLIGFVTLDRLLALVSEQIEIYHFPVIFDVSSAVYGSLIFAGAAFFSALLVYRKLRSLDLVSVLKLRD